MSEAELDVESGSSDGLVRLELTEVGPESGDEGIVDGVGVGVAAVVCLAAMLDDGDGLAVARGELFLIDGTAAAGLAVDDD